MFRVFGGTLALLAVVCAGAVTARADLGLTSAGTQAGYSLSTFASGFPNCCGTYSTGPLGLGFPTSGGVLVTDYSNGAMYYFANNSDGQQIGMPGVSVGTIYPTGFTPLLGGGYQAFGFPDGVAQLGGNLYLALQGSSVIIQINGVGSYVATVVSIANPTGMEADAARGLLYVSDPAANVVFAVNPATQSWVPWANAAAPDGLSLSADGKTLYVAAEDADGSALGRILGFDTGTKTLVYVSPLVSSLDGVVYGTGRFSGFLLANTNDGKLYQIDLSSNQATLIADGGSRGDFVTEDPNGTILITQSDRILRLSSVPEPSSLILLCSGLASVILVARLRAS